MSTATLRTWGRALHVIPRLDKAAWNRLDIVARWLVATRAAVLILTLSSAAIGGLLAHAAGGFDLLLWSVCAAGLVLAHATNNLVNDLTDWVRGVDKGNYFRNRYGPQPLEAGLMTAKQSYAYIAFTGGLALACGGYLIWARGEPVVWLMGVGVFFVLFYTYPLKPLGLGELAVLPVWGPLMVGGTFYVTTGTWSWPAAWASLPYALGATTVIFGKHIDKLEADKAKGMRTLPIRLGEPASRVSVILMLIAMYLTTGALIWQGWLGPMTGLILLALPALLQTIDVYRAPRPEERPSKMRADVWPLWFVALAFWHNRRFGLLFVAGLLIDVLVLGWSLG